MKTRISSIVLTFAFCAVVGCAGAAPAANPAPSKEGVAESTRPSDHIKRETLPEQAKIKFEQALKLALAAAPGHAIKGELEIEGGVLMYSFDIVKADKKIMEVEIDAGDGHVLGIDND